MTWLFSLIMLESIGMYVQERVYKLGKERNEDHRLDSEMKIVKESLGGERRSVHWSPG